MPLEFRPQKITFRSLPRKLHLPARTSQSPVSAINQLNFGARRVARWRGLRRSGRGLCLLGRHPGAAWRRRLETSGASSSRRLSCWRCWRLLPPSSLLLLLSDTDYFLSAVSKWSWEGGDCKSGGQLKSQTLRPPPLLLLLRNASVELLEARALCVRDADSVCISGAAPNSGLRSVVAFLFALPTILLSLGSNQQLDLSTHLSMIEWDHPSPVLPPPLLPLLSPPTLPTAEKLTLRSSMEPQCHTFAHGKLFPGLSARSEPV